MSRLCLRFQKSKHGVPCLKKNHKSFSNPHNWRDKIKTVAPQAPSMATKFLSMISLKHMGNVP